MGVLHRLVRYPLCLFFCAYAHFPRSGAKQTSLRMIKGFEFRASFDFSYSDPYADPTSLPAESITHTLL